jgi:hypothetical protein
VPPHRHPKPVRPTLRLHVVQRFVVLAGFAEGVSTSPPAEAASARWLGGVDGAKEKVSLIFLVAALTSSARGALGKAVDAGSSATAVFNGDSGATICEDAGAGDGAAEDCILSLNSSSPNDLLKQTEHILLRGAEPKNPHPPAQRLEALLLHMALSILVGCFGCFVVEMKRSEKSSLE